MRLTYSHEWPVHLKVTSEEASRTDRPRESLHEIYDLAMVLDTAGCVVSQSRMSVRLLADGTSMQPDEAPLPSPSLYVSAGFPCHSLMVFDQAGCHLADVTLSLHSAVHIAGVPATSEALLHRYHIGRVHVHCRALYVADCEFDLVYVCDLAGDVRHVISWPEVLCAPMGLCVGHDRLYVCDSGHKRVRVYSLDGYRPLAGEDSPGQFAGVHSRGVCQCGSGGGQRLVVGDFDAGGLLVLDGGVGGAPRRVDVPGVGEPFGVVPGPLAHTVFVTASSSTGDHSVSLVDVGTESTAGRRLATCGGPGSGPGEFNKPRGLAYDAGARRLYVVDARNFRVQVFNFED